MFDRQSKLVEAAVNELEDLLKSQLSEAELQRMMPEENAQEPDAYAVLLNSFTQKNTEALVKCNINVHVFFICVNIKLKNIKAMRCSLHIKAQLT